MKIALSILLYLWAFFYTYILVMGIYRAHLSGRLSTTVFILCLPAIGIGYAMDIVGNLLAAILLLDLPQEWLVTTRLQRYKATDTGWRLKVAEAICEGLLDVFDPTGDHC